MRIGDHVFHGPTEETWIVARVDDESVYPLGWPCAQAKRADCTLVEPCTDEQHARLIEDLTRLPSDDPRRIEPRLAFMIPDEPRPAYFGDCESCGDGTSRVYLGRTIGDITNAITGWIASGHQPESITITMAMYDNASVDALPDM